MPDTGKRSPPLAAPAEPPSLDDRTAYAEQIGLDPEQLGFSEFTESGFWDVDDVLRSIFEEASEVLGQEFECPERK